jgi:hypothetical protein
MSVLRAQHELSSSEFIDWVAYLEIKKDEHDKFDYYLSQIAAQFPRYLGDPKKSGKVQDKDYLVRFEKGESKRHKYPDHLSKDQKISRSKSAWCGFAGISRNG